MTLDQKIDRFLTETREQRVGGWTAAPPLVRLFWLLRLDVSPPYYWSFATIALAFGITFGVIIFCFDVLVFRDHPGWHRQAVSSAIAGALYGLFMAWYTRSKAKRLRLSPWDSQPAGDV